MSILAAKQDKKDNENMNVGTDYNLKNKMLDQPHGTLLDIWV